VGYRLADCPAEGGFRPSVGNPLVHGRMKDAGAITEGLDLFCPVRGELLSIGAERR
jgi:hypothetical protein